MRKDYKYQIWLHLSVFIFGTTGILGKLISLGSYALVWYRLLVALFALFFVFSIAKRSLALDRRTAFMLLVVGLILGAHWLTFFEVQCVGKLGLLLQRLSVYIDHRANPLSKADPLERTRNRFGDRCRSLFRLPVRIRVRWRDDLEHHFRWLGCIVHGFKWTTRQEVRPEDNDRV